MIAAVLLATSWADEPCLGDPASGDLDADGWCLLDADGSVLDCDDEEPERFPELPEACDGVDNDCVDDVPQDERDMDGDGVFPCGGDCDDRDPSASPYEEEFCGDDVDNNCDGVSDEGCVPGPAESTWSCAAAGGPASSGAALLLMTLALTRRGRKR